MYTIILGFITSFTLTYMIIPIIIRVAKERRLYDAPNERSAHVEPTPSLGGIAIFAGTVCAIVLWTPMQSFGVLQYILAAFILIFLTGILDDLVPMSPTKKLSGQMLVSIILAYKANVRITSLFGLFGIYELPEITSFSLSIIAIIGIINAFNLIDGINGLAGSIGLWACLLWGSWFAITGVPAMAVLAFSLAGAIVAFLKYNLTPAKIFMGDTGSLFIGMVCAVLAINFIEINSRPNAGAPLHFDTAPVIAVGVLIFPLFDTVRVFARRILNGKSPFSPDRNHIHHLLLNVGWSHSQATVLLVGISVVFTLLALLLRSLGTIQMLFVLIGLAWILTEFLSYWERKKRPATDKNR
ncbi:MAG: undecaprenyl/decaprenyl-phosphate alpha-N-acetylglucosaminyl 1-phosphate transferase [Saprospiraceae bacterium]|nr:undecaprenyl/decaprenyl-phosphate alpha-N-acetylglucosaminyl 1-phosphate transferase [Saprospiraceae bacterium]